MDISVRFRFAAAHFLTQYHGKCEALHGHNYTLVVTVRGSVAADGMVLDFTILKQTVKDRVVDVLDHTHLNDRFENPSAEHVVRWIWQELQKDLPLKELSLYETEDQWVTYDGNA